jgi:hypothetical protein
MDLDFLVSKTSISIAKEELFGQEMQSKMPLSSRRLRLSNSKPRGSLRFSLLLLDSESGFEIVTERHVTNIYTSIV